MLALALEETQVGLPPHFLVKPVLANHWQASLTMKPVKDFSVKIPALYAVSSIVHYVPLLILPILSNLDHGRIMPTIHRVNVKGTPHPSD